MCIQIYLRFKIQETNWTNSFRIQLKDDPRSARGQRCHMAEILFLSLCTYVLVHIHICTVNTHSVYSLKYFNSYNMFFNHMFSKPPAAPFIKIIFHFKGIVCRNKVFKNKVLSPRQVCLHSTVNTWEKIKSWSNYWSEALGKLLVGTQEVSRRSRVQILSGTKGKKR